MHSFPDRAIMRVGSVASRDKPTVLFLHGFLGCKEDWRDVIAGIRKGCDAIAVDLPGHGKNQPEDDSLFSMSACAEAIISLLDELNFGSVRLVGYSMGGRLALYLTVNHPDRFSRVMIESASPGLRTANEREERIKQDNALAKRITSMPMAEFVKDWYRLPLFSGLQNHSDELQEIISSRLLNQPSGLVRSLGGMGTGAQPSLWDSLSSIKVPLLIVAGKDDSKFVNISREMADLCNTATLCILEGSSHLIHVEKKDAFLERLNSFLE